MNFKAFFILIASWLATSVSLAQDHHHHSQSELPYTAADAVGDIRSISKTRSVKQRLLDFISRWESHDKPIGDLYSSVGWRLCRTAREESECYSGADNNLDHTIGWGLCMASGRVRTDCFSGSGNNLDSTWKWGQCMAQGQARSTCLSLSSETEDSF